MFAKMGAEAFVLVEDTVNGAEVDAALRASWTVRGRERRTDMVVVEVVIYIL
jgi:hypothetical protein